MIRFELHNDGGVETVFLSENEEVMLGALKTQLYGIDFNFSKVALELLKKKMEYLTGEYKIYMIVESKINN